jgi:hypothetical protein
MKIFEFSSKYEFFGNELTKDDEKKAYKNIFDELIKHGVNVNFYALGVPDAHNDGGFCIHKEQGFWVVYNSERGARFGVSLFSALDDAANFFVWLHVSNPKSGNTDVKQLNVFQ